MNIFLRGKYCRPTLFGRRINGTLYFARFLGIREAVKAFAQCDGDELKLEKYLLSNTIIEPQRLLPSDFENMDEYKQVIQFAKDVVSGRLADKYAGSGFILVIEDPEYFE